MIKHGSLRQTLERVIAEFSGEKIFSAKPIRCFQNVTDIPSDEDMEYLVDWNKYQYINGEVRPISEWTKDSANITLLRCSYMEAEKTILNLTEAQSNAFPIIFVDSLAVKFERVGDDIIANLGTVIIATNNYDGAESTEDVREIQTFEPKLRPIFDNLIKSLEDTGLLMDKKYSYYEHFFFGNKTELGYTGQKFSTYIDAIEINNLKIKLLKTC